MALIPGMMRTSPSHLTDLRHNPALWLASLGIFAASLGFGLVPFFSRSLTDQGIAPHAVAAYRYVFNAIVLLPIILINLHQWRGMLWGAVAGALMGLGAIGYITALETVPVSTVGVLYMTYPVFTVLLAWLFFRDHPSARAIVSALIIVLAAAIASSPVAISPDQLPTLLLSLTAPIGFGFGICTLVHKLSSIKPLARVASVSLGALLGLTPLIVVTPAAELFPRDTADWMLIAGIALGTAFFPMLIYCICSPMIGTSRSAVIGSIELPTFFLVGLIAFGEAITWPQATACAMILFAIAITPSKSARNVAGNLTRP